MRARNKLTRADIEGTFSETRSEASKRAWITIRRNRALKAVAS